jgi:hypothetical protein
MSRQAEVTDAIRNAAIRAERRRRGRHVIARIAKLAPIAAGVLLLFAVVARLGGLSPLVPVAALVLVASAFAMYFVAGRRVPAIGDASAARLDADAGLGGELRSAHWFIARDPADAWEAFHVDRAAAAVQATDWTQTYPPVRAGRSWAVTAGLVAATAIATMQLTPRPSVVAAVNAAIGPRDNAGPVVEIPPELRKELAALLAKMDGKPLSPEDAKTLADLASKFSGEAAANDPSLAEMLKKLQQAAKEKDANGKIADDAPENAAAGNVNDMKEVLKNLEERLSKTHQGDKASGTGDPDLDDSGKGDVTQASASEGDANKAAGAQMAMRMMRETATDSTSQMMMQGGGPMGGDQRPGAGNNGARGRGEAPAPPLDALKRELIEANADSAGANIQKEDLRRKTEQGRSTLGFTHTAPPGSYAAGRAVPPPAVPDARRPLVQSYFVIKR